jgi:hypothetical protein
MKSITARSGVSTTAFAGTVIVLLIVASLGYGLYATQQPQTVTTTITASASASSAPAQLGFTGGFLNNKIVSFVFYRAPVCSPSLTSLFNDKAAANASAKTSCEVGAKGTFPAAAVPVWGMVPMFAGLSVFGVPQFGSTPQGFPTYRNQTILTNCAAIGSPLSCPDHPMLMYSPAFVMVQQSMGISNGLMGLPEGVMPFPAHTHIVSTDDGQKDVPWDVVSVLVWDPNIFPNPVTGTCTQTVPSSLTNATANCLTSLTALQGALTTTNNAVAQANANNPVWAALGKPLTQVIIPGVTDPSQITNSNTNIDVPFAVVNQNPYPPYIGRTPDFPYYGNLPLG